MVVTPFHHSFFVERDQRSVEDRRWGRGVARCLFVIFFSFLLLPLTNRVVADDIRKKQKILPGISRDPYSSANLGKEQERSLASLWRFRWDGDSALIEGDVGSLAADDFAYESHRQLGLGSSEVYLNPEDPSPPTKQLALISHMKGGPVGREQELERYKRQPLQSVSVKLGGVSGVSSGGLQQGFVDLGVGTGIPLGSFDHLLGVTPRVRIDWLGLDDDTVLPANFKVPDALYQFELQFFYRREFSERLSVLAIASPAIRSDLTTDNRALRLCALGLVNWEWLRDRVTLSAGVVMLGRADLPVLPALGLLWTPNRRTRFDLRFPLARVSYRLTKNGAQSETWAYLTGGLGGTTWAVTRKDQETDEFSLRDYRLLAGWERIVSGGGGCFAEIGVAMGRRLEWEQPELEVSIPTSAMIQAGWRY